MSKNTSFPTAITKEILQEIYLIYNLTYTHCVSIIPGERIIAIDELTGQTDIIWDKGFDACPDWIYESLEERGLIS